MHDDQNSLSRDQKGAVLGFEPAARKAFQFLSKRGFQFLSSETTIVRYASDKAFLNIYHGRRSYELGVEVCPSHENREPSNGYSLETFVRIANWEEANRLRYFVAITPESVNSGLQRLVKQVKKYVLPALEGDENIFEQLKRVRTKHAAEYWDAVRAEQVRPRADEAFRKHDFDLAVRLLSEIEDQLTQTDKIKLDYARRHL